MSGVIGEVRFLGDLQRLELKPGDRFVLTLGQRPVTAELRDRIQAAWADFIGAANAEVNKLLVIDGEMRLGAIGPLGGNGLTWEPSDDVDELIAERMRQIEVEGWSPEHDDRHEHGELLEAATCYLLSGLRMYDPAGRPSGWPWPVEWWKPKGPRRDLVRAGALCLAEQDRLTRLGYGRQDIVQRKFDSVVAALRETPADGEPETGGVAS